MGVASKSGTSLHTASESGTAFAGPAGSSMLPLIILCMHIHVTIHAVSNKLIDFTWLLYYNSLGILSVA